MAIYPGFPTRLRDYPWNRGQTGRVGYFDGVNPVQGTAFVSSATRPVKAKHAYSIDEINAILRALLEPATTAFAIAAYAGLRIGEILGLRWQHYRDGELHVEQSIWRGKAKAPKTTSSLAPVPVIRQLTVILDMHQLRSGNPTSGIVLAHPRALRTL